MRIRDFQEINMKPRISEDSELGGRGLGGFTVYFPKITYIAIVIIIQKKYSSSVQI